MTEDYKLTVRYRIGRTMHITAFILWIVLGIIFEIAVAVWTGNPVGWFFYGLMLAPLFWIYPLVAWLGTGEVPWIYLFLEIVMIVFFFWGSSLKDSAKEKARLARAKAYKERKERSKLEEGYS